MISRSSVCYLTWSPWSSVYILSVRGWRSDRGNGGLSRAKSVSSHYSKAPATHFTGSNSNFDSVCRSFTRFHLRNMTYDYAIIRTRPCVPKGGWICIIIGNIYHPLSWNWILSRKRKHHKQVHSCHNSFFDEIQVRLKRRDWYLSLFYNQRPTCSWELFKSGLCSEPEDCSWPRKWTFNLRG